MARARRARTSAFGRGDLVASLVLVFPLFVAYEIGVLFSSTVNGVDVITRVVYAACGRDRALYLLVHVTLAAAYLVWLRAQRRDRTLAMDVVGPLLVEASLYALSLGLVLPLVLAQAHLAIAAAGAAAPIGSVTRGGATGDAIVISLGAGVHEELVFRLGIMAGGIALLRRTELSPRAAFFVALCGSALLFSLAHHLGAYGEPFHLHAFVFRALVGVLFGLVFWYRSFAHAVYAHVLYDLYVLALR
jgi:hypothetical protein